MSFILDAIAKSEHERRQQEMPGARTLAAPVVNVQKPRQYLYYLLVGALLLNAVIVAIWMQTGKILPDWSSPSQVASIDQSNGQDEVSDNTSTAKKVTQIESIQTINQSSARQQSTSPNEVLDAVPTSIRKSDAEQLAPVAPMTNGNTASADAMNNADFREVIAEIESRKLLNKSIVAQRGATDAGQSSVSEPVQSDPAVKETSGDTTAWVHIGPDSLSKNTLTGQDAVAKQSIQNNAKLYRKVSSLRELPDTVRKDLPGVVFSGHLYSSNPRLSVVFMEAGHPMKQGQEIADELYLHEITPTGVIVEFRGYLIDVGVLQNWTLN